MEDIRYSYGDKKSKRMWINCFAVTGYSEELEHETGYLMSIEIGLNKGTHTYIKGVWCYHNTKRGLPYSWDESIAEYEIDFNSYLEGALQFAIDKGYCK